MADQTTPETGVEGGTLSVEQRLANLYGAKDAPASASVPETVEPPQQDAAPETAEQESDQADDLSPDDIPDDGEETAQPPTDAFEIVHNGQQKVLSRDEVISLAQKGFDYTEKTQQLAQTRKQANEMLAQAQQIAQMTPLLAREQAALQAFEQQLSPWQNVDWVRLATEEPLEYPRYRAQYEQLLNGYNAARGAFNNRASQIQTQREQITRQMIEQEMHKLHEFLPGISDSKKFSEVRDTIAQYGAKDGYTPEEIAAVGDARYVRTLWKAAQYDKLVQGKADKVKQMRTAPPTTKPGAAGQTQSAESKRTQAMRSNLKKSGDWRDAAALLARIK